MASDECFRTPTSSTDDLLSLSPRQKRLAENEQHETKNDFFCDSLCDVTMQEVIMHDDMCMDSKSLDYLDKCTASNKNPMMIDRGKDSLFVKFDPLYAKTILTTCAKEKLPEHLSENDIGYETCSSNSVLTDSNSANFKLTSSTGSVFSKCGIDKPTQVVCPVVSSNSEKSTTETKVPTLIRSVSAILTPTQVGPELLVNLYGNTSSAQYNPQSKYCAALQDDNLHFFRITQNQDQELLNLRHEKKELQYSIHSIKEQFEDKITKLTAEVEKLKNKECKLVQQLNDKTLSYKQMAIVMEEYEKTISLLIEKQEKLSVEKEQALNHLASMESSFSDLLTKYESSKVVIKELKDSQKELMQKISEYEAGMKKYDCLYNTLKQSTTDNLNKANETLESINKSHNIEVAKLNAIIKKQEITLSSLHETLSQKIREVEELTKLNDQLINDVH